MSRKHHAQGKAATERMALFLAVGDSNLYKNFLGYTGNHAVWRNQSSEGAFAAMTSLWLLLTIFKSSLDSKLLASVTERVVSMTIRISVKLSVFFWLHKY